MTDGQIYDLGYRNYDGPRLGRWYAVRSLTALSVRQTFGLGRGTVSKVTAFVLTLFAFIPAIIQLVIGAVLPVDDFEFVSPDQFFTEVQVILVLFVAAMASELVGNDRKNNTLSLYFSRPIERHDYALSKIAALSIGLLALTLLPQTLLFIGNWLGASDGSEWLGDNWTDIAPIIWSAVLVCVQLGSFGIAVATHVSKRAFALVTVLGGLLVLLAAFNVVAEISDAGNAAIPFGLASPLTVIHATTLVMFGSMPELNEFAQSGGDDTIASLGVPAAAWIAASLAHIGAAVWLTTRRYRSLT